MVGIEVKLTYPVRLPMLNDKGIKTAIDRGLIKISNKISEDQLQPGSLDVRIGRTYVFDNDSQAKYVEEISKVANRKKFDLTKLDSIQDSRKYGKYYPDKKDTPIIIPPNAFAEIYPHEQISVNNKDFVLRYQLRTSRGRLGLQSWSEAPTVDNKGFYFSVKNTNPIPMKLYSQSKFANLFFQLQRRMRIGHGKNITNPKDIAKLLPEFADNNSITPEGYVLFRIGKEAVTLNNIAGDEVLGIIDTAKTIDSKFYEKHDLTKGYILPKAVSAIVQLTPKVNLPKNVGIMLLHDPPYSMEIHQYGFLFTDSTRVKSGWVDQGYVGGLNGQPISYMFPKFLKEGTVIAFGLVYQYNSDSDSAYGDSNLNSHYQNSSGATTSRS